MSDYTPTVQEVAQAFVVYHTDRGRSPALAGSVRQVHNERQGRSVGRGVFGGADRRYVRSRQPIPRARGSMTQASFPIDVGPTRAAVQGEP